MVIEILIGFQGHIKFLNFINFIARTLISCNQNEIKGCYYYA